MREMEHGGWRELLVLRNEQLDENGNKKMDVIPLGVNPSLELNRKTADALSVLFVSSSQDVQYSSWLTQLKKV